MLYSKEVIQKRVREIADEINKDYAGSELHIVSMLNGASVFCSDLIREIKIPVILHHFGFNSYSPAAQDGQVCITRDIVEPLNDKHILILEGVIVTGKTPKYVFDYLSLRNPKTINFCTIGVKKKTMTVDLPVKYFCFEFTSEIVVGYGIGSGAEKQLSYLKNKTT